MTKKTSKKNEENQIKLNSSYRVQVKGKTYYYASKVKTAKDHILLTFALACKDQRRIIKRSEVKDLCKILKPVSGSKEWVETPITRDMYRHHIGEFTTVKTEAQKRFPELYQDVIEEMIYIPKQVQKVQKVINDKNIKRYVITTAVANAPVHRNFIKSMTSYCKKNKAALLVLPADNKFEDISDFFHDNKDLHVIFDEQTMTENLMISNIKIKPTMLNPLTGLDRVCKKQKSSVIVPSPKQAMKPVPTNKDETPTVLMSTGACTYPEYLESKKYGQKSRRDYMATNDHVMGAVIIEVESRDKFHFRPIQAEANGSFIDLGVKYKANGKTSRERAEAISLGDWHSVEKQWDVCRVFVEEVAKEVQAKEVILHDFFDGQSISHHEKDSIARKAALALENRLSLADEFKIGVDDLNYLTKHFEKVVMVPSNHNEFVDRLLNDKRWIVDSENAMLCSLLFPYAVVSEVMNNFPDPKEATKMIAKKLGLDIKTMNKNLPSIGKSPVQVGCEMYDMDNPEKVKWLNRDEEYKIASCELGQHGDKGPHGSRGSANSLEKVLGNAIIGHSHTPCWHLGIIQNGTLSRLDPAYATGPSGWMHTSTILYKNGAKQPINVIDGKWRVK